MIIVEEVLVSDEYQISSPQSFHCFFFFLFSLFFPMDNYLSVKNTIQYHLQQALRY